VVQRAPSEPRSICFATAVGARFKDVHEGWRDTYSLLQALGGEGVYWFVDTYGRSAEANTLHAQWIYFAIGFFDKEAHATLLKELEGGSGQRQRGRTAAGAPQAEAVPGRGGGEGEDERARLPRPDSGRPKDQLAAELQLSQNL